MNAMRMWAAALLGGVLSCLIVFGGLALALIEGGVLPALPAVTPVAGGRVVTLAPGEPTYTPSPTLPPTITSTPGCLPPAGWVNRLLDQDLTMRQLAEQYGLSLEALTAANCLSGLYPNLRLMGYPVNLPAATPTPPATPTPVPTATSAQVACIPGSGPYAAWRGSYTVRSGDTLSSIARKFVGITSEDIRRANCLPNVRINTGQPLRVPYTLPPATSTATPTQAPTATSTPAATPTATSAPPTNTAAPPTNPPPTTAVPTVQPSATATPAPPSATATAPPASPTPTNAPPTVSPVPITPSASPPPAITEPPPPTPTEVPPTVPPTLPPTAAPSLATSVIPPANTPSPQSFAAGWLRLAAQRIKTD